MNFYLKLARHKRIIQFFFLVFFCLIIYIPSLKNGFIWDDDAYLYKSSWIQKTDGLRVIWLTHKTFQYYPLVFTSFWLEHNLWGLNPFGYHTVNLILHILNAFLLFWLALKIYPRLAFIVTLLFAIHPIQVETVAWIAERKNLLSLFFFLLSTLVYLRFDHTRRIRYYLLSVVMFVFALLSKSVAACFIFVPALYKWWRDGKVTWREARLSAIFIVLGLLSGLHTLYLELYNVGAHGKEFALTLLERVILSGKVIFFYIHKIIFPFHFMFFYPRWQIDVRIWWQWLFPVAVMAALGLLIYYRKRTGRGALALFIFYVVSIFPALGFVNVFPMKFSFVADHFSYLSTPALLLLLCTGLTFSFDKLKIKFFALRSTPFRIFLMGLFIFMVIYLCGKSMVLTQNYKNETTLWSNLIRDNPKAWIAYNNLGVIYDNVGKTESAIDLYTRAITINPDYSEAYNNRGNVYRDRGNIQQAISDFNKAIAINPNFAEAYNNRGTTYRNQGNIRQAILDYNKAIEIDSSEPNIYYNRAIAYEEQGNIRQAVSDYTRVIAINPNDAEAYNNRGTIFSNQGSFSKAISDYTKAIVINPKYANTYNNRGLAYFNQGNLFRAISDYTRAIEINPGYAEAYNNRGVAYFMVKEYSKAWADAHKAEGSGYTVNPEFLNALKRASSKEE